MMYSPIVYDRQGKPVGGGANIHETTVECQTCRRRWCATASELEIHRGDERAWQLQP